MKTRLFSTALYLTKRLISLLFVNALRLTLIFMWSCNIMVIHYHYQSGSCTVAVQNWRESVGMLQNLPSYIASIRDEHPSSILEELVKKDNTTTLANVLHIHPKLLDMHYFSDIRLLRLIDFSVRNFHSLRSHFCRICKEGGLILRCKNIFWK